MKRTLKSLQLTLKYSLYKSNNTSHPKITNYRYIKSINFYQYQKYMNGVIFCHIRMAKRSNISMGKFSIICALVSLITFIRTTILSLGYIQVSHPLDGDFQKQFQVIFENPYDVQGVWLSQFGYPINQYRISLNKFDKIGSNKTTPQQYEGFLYFVSVSERMDLNHRPLDPQTGVVRLIYRGDIG